MPNNGTCPECRPIWEELASSTMAHIKIVGQKQLALLQQNSSLLKEIEPLVLAASERREVARRAYHDHADTHQQE